MKKVAGIIQIFLGIGIFLYSASISTSSFTIQESEIISSFSKNTMESIISLSRIFVLVSIGFIIQGVINLKKE